MWNAGMASESQLMSRPGKQVTRAAGHKIR
jgi:hypothetical protein